MDEADFAQERIDRELSSLISSMALPVGRSAHFCMDCDERIDERRRRAYPGVQRCVECQECFERINISGSR